MIKLAPPAIIKVNTVEEFINTIVEKSFPYGLFRIWEEQIYTYGAGWSNNEYVRINGNKKKEILQQLKMVRRNYF